MIRSLRAGLVALCLGDAQAATPGFVHQCDALVSDARISVVFEDAAVARDNAHSLQELKELSRKSTGPYHQVFGLTTAQAAARYSLRAAMLTDADGSVCAVASVALTLAVAGLTVYLARELTNPCKRAIVDAHELEHVGVWRSHLRSGAPLLEHGLRSELAQPVYLGSAETARAGLRERVQVVLNPFLRNLQDGIVEANRQIDSPASYQATSRRLRACR